MKEKRQRSKLVERRRTATKVGVGQSFVLIALFPSFLLPSLSTPNKQQTSTSHARQTHLPDNRTNIGQKGVRHLQMMVSPKCLNNSLFSPNSIRHKNFERMVISKIGILAGVSYLYILLHVSLLNSLSILQDSSIFGDSSERPLRLLVRLVGSQ